MAAARFIQRGRNIDHIPDVNIAAGDVVVQGDLVGVARTDIRGGTQGAIAVAGVFDLPKATGVSTQITIGTKLYWDAANRMATASDGGGANKYLGKAIKTAPDTAMYVRVRLSQ